MYGTLKFQNCIKIDVLTPSVLNNFSYICLMMKKINVIQCIAIKN